jgi:hypothetical protein
MVALGAGYYVRPDEDLASDQDGAGVRGSVGEQQGHLLMFYGDAQTNSNAWVASWMIKSSSGSTTEGLLSNLALLLIGSALILPLRSLLQTYRPVPPKVGPSFSSRDPHPHSPERS